MYVCIFACCDTMCRISHDAGSVSIWAGQQVMAPVKQSVSAAHLRGRGWEQAPTHDQHASHGSHARDGVGHAHEGRVQGRSHAPDRLVPTDAGQAKFGDLQKHQQCGSHEQAQQHRGQVAARRSRESDVA